MAILCVYVSLLYCKLFVRRKTSGTHFVWRQNLERAWGRAFGRAYDSGIAVAAAITMSFVSFDAVVSSAAAAVVVSVAISY